MPPLKLLGHRAVAVVGIGLVCMLVWLSADSGAHERFHHDADHADHHCVVSEFSAGEAIYAVPTIVIHRPDVRCQSAAYRAAERPPEPVAYRLLPSCGPPRTGLSA